MRCAHCGADNPEGRKFCEECGTKIISVCPSCGHEVRPAAKFCGECGTALTSKSKGNGQSRLDVAERRQLTVLFCDLVGSTALSAQLDPEELREVVRGYQQTSAAIIERFDGSIAQYLGDGLLVYFGYPAAHEDDAARAVRAGLEIVQALQRLSSLSPFQGEGRGEGSLQSSSSNSPPSNLLPQGEKELQELQVRIGIHTGPVVVGEMGGGAKREQLALGETPNIAARIQGQAESNTVVISATTYRLVEGLFECEDRGQPALKGVATPLTLYRVLKEGEAQSRFQVVARKGLTPLVGREHEFGLLRERWERVRDGEGQVVLLSGEPGIGKSRLVEALKDSLKHEGGSCLELRCSPYHQNSAFYPVIEHLQRVLHFERDEAPAAKLVKLETALRGRGEVTSPLQEETFVLLTGLLSLPPPEGYPPLSLSPQKQKEKTYEALVAWLRAEAQQQAVMYAWEDLHWADPSTLELLTLFLAQVPTTRVLAVLTFRPEFTPPWGSHSYLSQMLLSRLSRAQVGLMVEKVTGGKALPVEVIQQIVRKTDGVPLFVEELTKMVIETMREQGTGDRIQEGKFVGTRHAAPVPTLGIPTTLHDALMARLDRLGPAKEIAQRGATIGREFSYEVLHVVSPVDEETLQHGLRELVETELVYQRGVPPRAIYLFKHALIQDTAYQSLLKSKRQQYHRQIAKTLEEQFPQTVEAQPELVAHHYTEASLIAQAIPYWQQAGERASQHSANLEAIRHFAKGLEMLKALPDTPKRIQQELTLQLALGAPLMATKGYADPELENIYARAQDLAQQSGETQQLFWVLRGQWQLSTLRAELQKARNLAEQLLDLVRNIQDPAFFVEAHFAAGNTFLWRGEFILARDHLEQGLLLYDPQQHAFHARHNGYDTGVSCLSFAAQALWCLGYPDQAMKSGKEALVLARKLSHSYTLVFALAFTARFYRFLRDTQTAQERAEEMIDVSTEQGFAFARAMGVMLRGAALTTQGLAEKGIELISQGLDAYRVTGAELERLGFLALLAEAHGKVGRAKKGLDTLAETLDVVDKTGERLYEAELYRLKGELLLAQESQKSKGKSQKSKVETDPRPPAPDPQGEAEACFLKSLEVAREQQAKSWELRTATSLARLWQQQGKQEEAHRMMSEIYSWFTEGFDTKDLQEAKALIAELDRKKKVRG